MVTGQHVKAATRKRSSRAKPRGLAVALLSGGLDSTTLAYYLKNQGYQLRLLSVDYGQRHSRELQAAEQIAQWLNADWTVLDLGDTGELLSGSSLTDFSVEVPHGHYAAESMRSTIVPNRNAILLSIAYGIGVAAGATVVAFGAHAGDHTVYPDCRPEFVSALNRALRIGNLWANPVPVLEAPFVHETKTDIARLASMLNVPIESTYSCYEGRAEQCGLCGTCVERRQALYLAGVKDLTSYNSTWEESCEAGELDPDTGLANVGVAVSG